MKTLLAICLVAFWLTASAADPKPNILLIVGDDMGHADVGFHGCKDIPTRHLDALAASGVRFTSGYQLQAQWDQWNLANVKPLWGNGSGDNDGSEPGAKPKRKKE